MSLLPLSSGLLLTALGLGFPSTATAASAPKGSAPARYYSVDACDVKLPKGAQRNACRTCTLSHRVFQVSPSGAGACLAPPKLEVDYEQSISSGAQCQIHPARAKCDACVPFGGVLQKVGSDYVCRPRTPLDIATAAFPHGCKTLVGDDNRAACLACVKDNVAEHDPFDKRPPRLDRWYFVNVDGKPGVCVGKSARTKAACDSLTKDPARLAECRACTGDKGTYHLGLGRPGLCAKSFFSRSDPALTAPLPVVAPPKTVKTVKALRPGKVTGKGPVLPIRGLRPADKRAATVPVTAIPTGARKPSQARKTTKIVVRRACARLPSPTQRGVCLGCFKKKMAYEMLSPTTGKCVPVKGR